MQPINYINPNLGPIKQQQGLFDAYQDVQLMKQQRADQAIKNQAIASQQAKLEAFNNDFNAMEGNFNTGNIAKLMLKYPEYAEKYQKPWENFKTVEREQNLNNLKMVNSAVENGRVDLAIERLNDHATRYENAGNSQMAQVYSQAAEDMASNEDNAVITLRSMMLGADKEALDSYLGTQKLGGELEESVARTGKLKREADETRARTEEIEQTVSQKDLSFATEQEQRETDLENSQLAIRIKNESLGDLTEKQYSTVDEYIKESITNNNLARQSGELANKFDGLVKFSGLAGKTLGIIKRATGFDNVVDEMKTEYNRIKSKGIMEGLPKGAASDTDIALVAEGFPGADAPSEVISRFLRGLEKINLYDGLTKEASAEWVSKNKFLGSMKRPNQVMGIDVEKGMTFPQFMKKKNEDIMGIIDSRIVPASEESVVPKAQDQTTQGQAGRRRSAPQQMPAAIQTRSYMNLQAP